MTEAAVINELMSDSDLKITPLRKDVLDIFLSTKAPLSAYEVLAKLKSKRSNAQPPTVYRVIEYFVEKKIIHRVETGNKYVCCSQLNNFKSDYHGILFLCNKCQNSFEYRDENFLTMLSEFAKKNQLLINESLIEIKGVCGGCKAS